MNRAEAESSPVGDLSNQRVANVSSTISKQDSKPFRNLVCIFIVFKSKETRLLEDQQHHERERNKNSRAISSLYFNMR